MKKTIALLLAFVLVLGVAIGGTIAWLTAETDEVTNTFTVGDINIDLWEHKYNPETEELDPTAPTVQENNDYHFVPGDTLPKDPTVTVRKDSEDCYLFIKVTEKNNGLSGSTTGEKIINWTIDNNNWRPCDSTTDVYYCEVKDVTADRNIKILLNEQVTVNSNVTKDMVSAINGTKPTLSFDAYAHQMDNTTLEDATEAALEHFGVTSTT